MLLDHKRKTETQDDLVKEKQIKCVAQEWQGELCDPETALEVSELLVRENIKVISISRDLPPPQGWNKTSKCTIPGFDVAKRDSHSYFKQKEVEDTELTV